MTLNPRLRLACVAYVTVAWGCSLIVLVARWISFNLSSLPGLSEDLKLQSSYRWGIWEVSREAFGPLLMLSFVVGLPLACICRRSWWGFATFLSFLLVSYAIYVAIINQPEHIHGNAWRWNWLANTLRWLTQLVGW
jgi:hypothetical protein